ncbi:hypothetical protein WMZ97_19825 [Lentibacillus sp. N15]|uniref:hypothetical protein n=1 Tax=Lentibacillus songyuanensis TaxID=3136161 RepID=UPI0031B9F468
MDHAMKGLFFKEWKMMKGFFISQFVVMALLLIFPSFSIFSLRVDQLLELMVLGVIVIPAAFLFSLNTEVNQMQSFLHNPHSIHKLLSVKGMYSLFCAVSVLFVFIILITGYEFISPAFSMPIWKVWLYMLSMGIKLLVISIFVAVILLFLWTLHQIWRTYIGGGLSIVLVVALMIAGNWLFSFFVESKAFEVLTHWGKVFSTSGFMIGPGYLGVYVFYGVLTIFVYVVSAYLIDHKVEA